MQSLSNNIWRRDKIKSPCIKICVIDHEKEICVGCFRTIAEIANWSVFSHKKWGMISKNLKERKKLLEPRRRGGHSGRIQK